MSTFIKQTLFGLALAFIFFFGFLQVLSKDTASTLILVIACFQIGNWCQRIAEKVFTK